MTICYFESCSAIYPELSELIQKVHQTALSFADYST